MIKAKDIFKVFERANYIIRDEDDIVVFSDKPIWNDGYDEKFWSYPCVGYEQNCGELDVEEFQNKPNSYIIERRKPVKELKPFDEFVKWLKTKGTCEKECDDVRLVRDAGDIIFVDCGNNLVSLLEPEDFRCFYQGRIEQCKRVIEAMLAE